MQVVLHRDGQGVAIAAIRQFLPALGHAGVSVSSFKPSTLPARFVQVVRVGGVPDTVVHDRALLDVSAYVKGSDDAAAFELLAAVAGIVAAIDGETIGDAFVSDVDTVSGPANLPDPAVPLYQRVRQTFEIATRSQIVDI